MLCACQAGCCAALASVCGKTAASSESASNFSMFGAKALQDLLGLSLEQHVSEVRMGA